MKLFEWSEFTLYILRKHFRTWLAIFAIYLSLAGIVTFSLFILEESFQTAMFGTWPAQDAQRWDVVLDGTKIMDHFIWWMDVVNYSSGWIQPLAFISYRAYSKSAKYYTRSLKAKVLAHQPELMEGQKVKIKFIVKQITKDKYGLILSNGRLKIRSKERAFGIIDVEGVIRKTGIGYELIRIR